jgi:hypothetical protein
MSSRWQLAAVGNSRRRAGVVFRCLHHLRSFSQALRATIDCVR